MTTTTPPVAVTGELATTAVARKRLSSPWASLTAIVIAVLWTTPTLGLFLTSFRTQDDIRVSGWWNVFLHPNLTLDNYRQVFSSGTSTDLSGYFVNSIVITIPAVIAPVLLASLAAYTFAWIPFKGRDALFVAVFALQVVPLQVAMIPLLQIYIKWLHIGGSFWTVWISHTMFALPLAIFLLHNFMKEIPGELIEAARVDGAGHVRIFFQVLLPLITPALAAFGIFQFLWVWNDLLVGLVFLGGKPETQPLTVAIQSLAGTRGSAWYLLSAGAFVSIVVPLVVFLSLQRYFVRGLLAGGLKG
ncbi:carbohydrate ABC transporter membrane protein 2 (CUT1 family) [Motilibacter rhizosphaerae]|uniref:Carbohydrate ABC transporter membrane protein 2 (CUT1 family) n=1 Tax=Motilibacter rhizosphaerae TaxID=598652 RepID=A0A4Q7NPC1_9ACTN|nr:carbohydrate ABC transporter permease [Motilibacter rhizosphaerae]RZS86806.1 carbohydrate ABC transporter membrane protein 2 (CUT1 family) [Motilibacter rhizosphaerae]